jgi:hypothetical protein
MIDCFGAWRPSKFARFTSARCPLYARTAIVSFRLFMLIHVLESVPNVGLHWLAMNMPTFETSKQPAFNSGLQMLWPRF